MASEIEIANVREKHWDGGADADEAYEVDRGYYVSVVCGQ